MNNTIGKAQVFLVQKETQQTDAPRTGGPVGSIAWPYAYDALARLPELHPWHARCLEIVAAASVGIGYDVLTDGDELERRTRDTLEGLVGGTSFTAWCALLAYSDAATGNAYIEVGRNGKGDIAELFWMPPHFVWHTKKGGFIYRAAGASPDAFSAFGDRQGNQNEVIHIRTPFLRDRRYGLPRWISAIRAITLDNNAIDYNASFFANGAIPDLAIIVEGGEFTPEVELAVKDFLTNEFKGVANSHRTLYLPLPDLNVKVRFEKLNQETKDGSFHLLRMDNRDEIIGAHGVPPRLLGIMSAGALGGGGEVGGQILVFDQTTLQPRREKFAKTINQTIIKDMGLAEIAFRRIDATTAVEDAERVIKLFGGGVIDEGEARAEAGYEPRDEAPSSDSGGSGDDPRAGSGQADDEVGKSLAVLEKALSEAG